MCCTYSWARLISNSLQEVSSVILICDDRVGMTVGVIDEQNVTL